VVVVHVVQPEAHLLEVVGALGARGRLAHLLDGGQQQADEDGDDGYHHQQLDQREAPPRSEETEPWHRHSSRKRTEVRTEQDRTRRRSTRHDRYQALEPAPGNPSCPAVGGARSMREGLPVRSRERTPLAHSTPQRSPFRGAVKEKLKKVEK